jgi:hypothetical protein
VKGVGFVVAEEWSMLMRFIRRQLPRTFSLAADVLVPALLANQHSRNLQPPQHLTLRPAASSR